LDNLFESENISNLKNEENLKKKSFFKKKMKVEDFCLSNHARKPICKSQKKKKIRVKMFIKFGEKENY